MRDYNNAIIWTASFPYDARPTRRNVHARMHEEMQHHLRDAIRSMQRRGVTRYRVSFEWTPREIAGEETVYWCNIDVEYEEQEEVDNEQ